MDGRRPALLGRLSRGSQPKNRATYKERVGELHCSADRHFLFFIRQIFDSVTQLIWDRSRRRQLGRW